MVNEGQDSGIILGFHFMHHDSVRLCGLVYSRVESCGYLLYYIIRHSLKSEMFSLLPIHRINNS